MEKSLIFKSGNVKVADLFCSSWGYEQTNVTFYEVVALRGKKTVVLREIKKDYHPSGGMSGTVKPLPGQFVENTEMVKRIYDDGSELIIKIESYEYARKTTPEKAHRFSSYG